VTLAELIEQHCSHLALDSAEDRDALAELLTEHAPMLVSPFPRALIEPFVRGSVASVIKLARHGGAIVSTADHLALIERLTQQVLDTVEHLISGKPAPSPMVAQPRARHA